MRDKRSAHYLCANDGLGRGRHRWQQSGSLLNGNVGQVDVEREVIVGARVLVSLHEEDRRNRQQRE